MELRQLQCLVACAQTHSFSKAASQLFTSQSNVSKTIASLEKELGKKLFERRQHGIELTAKGRQIYKYALNMMEFNDKILDCAQEDEKQLKIVFQPGSWFASAFCEYYVQHSSEDIKYDVTSAPAEEIIHRIANDIDHLGFAYIEDGQFVKLQEVFKANHIGCLILKSTRTVLYHGKGSPEKGDSLRLIQGKEDQYSGIRSWKEKGNTEEKGPKPKVVITTNSASIMREILQRTNLSNISPEYLSHGEKAIDNDAEPLKHYEESLKFICIFRNDRAMEDVQKQFLTFVREYLKEN